MPICSFPAMFKSFFQATPRLCLDLCMRSGLPWGQFHRGRRNSCQDPGWWVGLRNLWGVKPWDTQEACGEFIDFGEHENSKKIWLSWSTNIEKSTNHGNVYGLYLPSSWQRRNSWVSNPSFFHGKNGGLSLITTSSCSMSLLTSQSWEKWQKTREAMSFHSSYPWKKMKKISYSPKNISLPFSTNSSFYHIPSILPFGSKHHRKLPDQVVNSDP